MNYLVPNLPPTLPGQGLQPSERDTDKVAFRDSAVEVTSRWPVLKLVGKDCISGSSHNHWKVVCVTPPFHAFAKLD